MRLTDAVRSYLNAMAAEGRSHHTVSGAKYALNGLAAYLESIDVTHIEQMDADALQRYREDLSWRRTEHGTPLLARTQAGLLGHLRSFCRWMVSQDWLVSDPSARIPNPRQPQQLPKAIMKPAEVQSILSQPDTHTATGFRDKVILEVMYSSGIRRQEVVRLLIQDVDLEQGFLMIREGKNSKDRVVPIGQTVCELLQSYLTGIRPDWINAKKDRHLFLNRFGHGMHPMAVWHIVRKSRAAAQIEKPVSPHTFRHTCATHMLQAGAQLRHLQELLGHASIETTQVYTRLTVSDLKEAHSRYHPREQDRGT